MSDTDTASKSQKEGDNCNLEKDTEIATATQRKEMAIEKELGRLAEQSSTDSIVVYTEKGPTLMAASLWPCLNTPSKGKDVTRDKGVVEQAVGRGS